MALIQDTYLTDKGFEIANKAANGQTSFEITKVVSSDQNINSKTKDEIKKLNNLSDEINSGQIINTDIKSNNLTGIVTQFGNDIYTSGYEVGAIALYAKENNSDNEFLYSVTPMVENQKIPEVNTNVFLGFQVTIYVVAGDSQRMNVNLSKGGDASIDLVEKLVSNAESDFQKKLDNKADKSDLSNLQTSVNNDIQPKLDNKANNSDLSNLQTNINSDIQPKLNNKYDKSEVDSRLNSAQNEAVNQAGQYTDQVKNNLQDKNNILSSQLSDSQKPNLVDLNMNSWLNTGNNANATMFQVNNVHFEAGKSYWFSLQYQDGSWKDTNPSMMFYKNDWDSFNGDYWILSYDPSHNKNTLNPIFHYVPQQDETVNIRLTRWSSTNEPIYIRGFTITQTDNYLPFEQAEINRKAWQSASQTDLDNAKSDLQNKTNDLSSKVDENSRKDNARMDYLGATKYDKSETYNKGEIDNKTDNLSSKIDSNYNDINNKITNSVNTSIQQANQTTNNLSKRVDSLDNNKANKSDLSSLQSNMATQSDLARLSKNSWRELRANFSSSTSSVFGSNIGGALLCKPDFTNNIAYLIGQISGTFYSYGKPDSGYVYIYHGNDFVFTNVDSKLMYPNSSYSNLQIDNYGNIKFSMSSAIMTFRNTQSSEPQNFGIAKIKPI